MRFNDLTGKVYGRLTVLQRGEDNCHGQCRYICECGNTVLVLGTLLRRGKTKSCGCFALESRTKHGMYQTRVYSIWHNMNTRCKNESNEYYGERGISVCGRWSGENGFLNFLEDMGLPPSDEHSIERLDVNGNYEPDNCTWATINEQKQNKRSSKLTDSDVIRIRALYETNQYNYSEIARMYNCDPSHIRKIILKQRWK